MRIAVTYEDGKIFQHFGRTEQFKIYDVQDGAIVSSTVVGTGGSGHGALAGVLTALKTDALICGGIGGGAQAALAALYRLDILHGSGGRVCPNDLFTRQEAAAVLARCAR